MVKYVSDALARVLDREDPPALILVADDDGVRFRCPRCGFVPSLSRWSEPKAAAALRRHSCRRHLQLVEQRRSRITRDTVKAATDPVSCPHPGSPQRHGTDAAYIKDGCHCPACRGAHARYNQQLRKRHAYGRFETEWVDAQEAVGQHIALLLAAGMTVSGIMRHAGVARSSIPVPQAKGSAVPIATTIRKDVADRILAVTVEQAADAGNATVDATGTRRRTQALVAIGWPLDDLADRAGVSRRTLTRATTGETVTPALAASVATIYEQLSMTVGPSRMARLVAARKGWPPPLAWDEDRIDDPRAEVEAPDADDVVDEVAVNRFLSGVEITLTRSERAAAAARLAADGHRHHAIATRLRTGVITVRTLLNEHEEKNR